MSEPAVPCEHECERLAQENPERLAEWIASGTLAAAQLTFAAEHLGTWEDSERVRAVLVPLLDHAQPIVREGALYGLSQHLDEPTRALVLRLADTDASWAVRMAARGVTHD